MSEFLDPVAVGELLGVSTRQACAVMKRAGGRETESGWRIQRGQLVAWVDLGNKAGDAVPKAQRITYFVSAGDYVKIGHSTRERLSWRILQMQVSWPFRMELECFEDDFGGMESYYHRKFREFRERGEWFRAAEPISATIDSIIDNMCEYDLDLLDTVGGVA